MSIIDGLKQTREKITDKQEGSAVPSKGHTLAEILGDPAKKRLFINQLNKNGYEKLETRRSQGKLQEADIDLLEEQRIIFSETMAESEKVEKLLTVEMVTGFARNHPDFEKITNLLDPEKAIRVIKSQLLEISMTDSERFAEIAEAMETHESHRNGKYKAVNDATEKLCKDKGISSKEYLDAMAIEDPKKKRNALRELSSRKYGKFKNALNSISLGALERSDADVLEVSESELQNSITELNDYQEKIGGLLAISVKANMMDAVARELSTDSNAAPESRNVSGDAGREMSYDASSDTPVLKERSMRGTSRRRHEGRKNIGFLSSAFRTISEGPTNRRRRKPSSRR